MREIVKIKLGRLKHFMFFLILLIGSYLVETPVFAHTPEGNQDRERVEIKGIVKDVQGETVIGATVRSKSNRFAGATTGVDGDFTIFVSSLDDILIFNYVGMEQKEVPLKAGTTFYNVILEVSKDTQLKDIVVEAGIIQHDRLSFTGAVTTVDREKLKAVGNVNVLQNLKAYDPGFVIMDNMSMGANPNVMAQIELRGQTTLDITTIQDEAAMGVNMPLFILDGFEATLEEINDLNVNMIESMTILKDAGSTAIYGAKGGNGVIVIETVKPEAGKIMVQYDGKLQLAAPDLTVYNMMNAAEKLEFERLAGRYGPLDETNGLAGTNSELYYERLKNVQKGLNTDWLAEPVRTGVTHSHAVTIKGGDKGLLFQAGLNYTNIQGVMKGSDRESWGGNVKLQYRFNRLNIANDMQLKGTNSYNGAYESFQTFVNANPYYPKRNEDGSIPKEVETYTDASLQKHVSYNPLYNSSLNTYSDSRNFVARNNTQIDWFINDDFRLKGTLGLYRSHTNAEDFTDPGHTKYINLDYTKQGQYKSKTSTSWYYDGTLNLMYNKLIAGHHFSINALTSIKNSKAKTESISAVGFPIGAPPVPIYAYSYTENSRPDYTETLRRQVSFIGTFNYDYLYRYMFNLSINREGTNTFGNKNKFESFFSAGLGWNLHKEVFAENLNWLNFFKVRANYGTNAIQNLSSNITTTSVYKYNSGYNIFGLSSYLQSYGNPYFQWQKVAKKTLGIETEFLDSRLNFKFDIYDNKTDPQASQLKVRASSGLTSYPVNMGWMKSKGFEFVLSVTPLQNLKKRMYLNFVVNGAHNNSKYGGYGNVLSQLNNELLSVEDNPMLNLVKYEDGRSPSDLWAVRSLGIDPATGREIFLKADGVTQTYQYKTEDRVAIVNSRPDLRGAFMVNFAYMNFRMNMTFYYSIGGHQFNNALYQKVENISASNIANNQDKRALYDRWQKTGDIAQFKGINLNEYTPISSRFIQKDTYLQGGSIQMSWDFSRDKWIEKFGMKSLLLTLGTNDLFTWSTMKVERGTDYPFQRSFSFNLTTTF